MCCMENILQIDSLLSQVNSARTISARAYHYGQANGTSDRADNWLSTNTKIRAANNTSIQLVAYDS